MPSCFVNWTLVYFNLLVVKCEYTVFVVSITEGLYFLPEGKYSS